MFEEFLVDIVLTKGTFQKPCRIVILCLSMQVLSLSAHQRGWDWSILIFSTVMFAISLAKSVGAALLLLDPVAL